MSVLVFENTVRFLPVIEKCDSIIRQVYDPEVFDYEVHTLSGMRADMEMFDALKQCHFLDSSGFFCRIGGMFTSGEGVDGSESSIIESVSSILQVIEKYHQFTEKKDDRYTKQVNTQLTPTSILYKVKGFSFTDRDIYSSFQSTSDVDLRKQDAITYTIYHNTEEDTIAYFVDNSFDETLLMKIFPELTQLGKIDVIDELNIVKLIRNHTDKSAVELWNIIQTECNVVLPPNIYPSCERLEATIRKMYTLSTERTNSVAFKTILKQIICEIYGNDVTPEPSTMRSIKRTLPKVLQQCGLEKKRMAEGFHWYGMDMKVTKPDTSVTTPESLPVATPESLNKLLEDMKAARSQAL